MTDTINPPTPADLAAIRVRHQRASEDGERCWECLQLLPCDTAVALTALDAARADVMEVSGFLAVLWPIGRQVVGEVSPQMAEKIVARLRDYERMAALTPGAAVAADAPRPVVVCLTGSTRFMDAYREAMRCESLKGHIVLTVAFDTHEGGSEVAPEQKVMLDDLHLRKIDLADEILVLNVGGYIGESTRREIAYAERAGKRIRWLEPVAADGAGGEE